MFAIYAVYAGLKKFSKIITNGVLRSTYRKSAERRSSVQKKASLITT